MYANVELYEKESDNIYGVKTQDKVYEIEKMFSLKFHVTFIITLLLRQSDLEWDVENRDCHKLYKFVSINSIKVKFSICIWIWNVLQMNRFLVLMNLKYVFNCYQIMFWF